MPYGSYLLAISLIWRLFSNELLCTPLNYYKLVMFLQKFREEVYEKNPLGALFLIQLMMIG